MFAKRSVNADRQARHEEEMKLRRMRQSFDADPSAKPIAAKQSHRKTQDHASSPSAEASDDPAPTEQSWENGDRKPEGVNTYIATKPYRSKKGDRFS